MPLEPAGHIEGLLERGEFLAAYDAARAALGDPGRGPVERLTLGYLQALALVRSGASHHAASPSPGGRRGGDHCP